MIDTYHRFKVPKKGGAKKMIIFHVLETWPRVVDTSTKMVQAQVTSEKWHAPKAKIMCQWIEQDPAG